MCYPISVRSSFPLEQPTKRPHSILERKIPRRLEGVGASCLAQEQDHQQENLRCGLINPRRCLPAGPTSRAPIVIRPAGRPLPRFDAATYAAGTTNWRACEPQKSRLQARVSVRGTGRWAHADASGGQGRRTFSIHLDSRPCPGICQLTSIRGGNIRLEKAKIAVILEVHACAQAEPPSSLNPTITPPSDLAKTASGIVTNPGMVAATPATLSQPCCFQLGDLS